VTRAARAALLLAALAAGACASAGPEAPGGVELVVLRGERAATDAALRTHLEEAARAVSLACGEPLVARFRAVIRPVEGRGGDPIVFGHTVMKDGPGIELFLRHDATDAELREDWVAVHELVHLAMPAVPREDAWFSEGWATYFTEVLKARAGLHGERDAWSELAAGFASGARARGGLALGEESARMHRRHTYHRVYWAGAALAFLADEELRRTTGGKLCLDDALRELRRLERTDDRVVPATEQMERLDDWLGRPLFVPLAARALASNGFPHVDEALKRLGVRAGPAGEVVLDEDAPGAAIRRAMTGRGKQR
jgi:hypothetical protein